MGKRIGLLAMALLIAVMVALAAVPGWRIRALGRARGENFHRGMPLSYWVQALDDPDPGKGNLRYDAILAVGHDRDAIPALRRRLQDPVPLLRHMAAVELSRFGPDAREAVPELVAMLQDDDRSCREAAADALAKIDPSAAPQAKTP